MARIQFTNLNTSPFTANGGLVPVDDLWNPLATAVLDGVNDSYTSTTKPYTNSGNTSQSGAVTMRADASTTNSLVLAQHSGATDRGFLVIVNTTLLIEFSQGGSNNFLRSILAAGTDGWDSGEKRIGWVTSGATTVKIYVNGVPATAYASQDVKTGLGFDGGFGANIDNLAIGANSTGGAPFFTGPVTRPTFWPDEARSDAQMLADFNDEEAAKGEGFDATGNVLATVFSEVMPDNGIMGNIIT